MVILINDKPADITLDTEKTIGDVLSGIEQWLSPLGNRIQGIAIDGVKISSDDLGGVFEREIKSTGRLEITVSSWRELAAEAMGDLRETCEAYENTAFHERGQIYNHWEEGTTARFLQSDMADIYNLAALTLSGEGISARELAAAIDERLRELLNTGQETGAAETLVRTIAQRMEELPLDIQTGKDQRAAETIQLFTRIGEKLFRIFAILKSERLSLDDFKVGDLPAKAFMEEFNAALRKLTLAYRNGDTVLMGDLSEYELAPRLLKFYLALKNRMEIS